MLNNYRFPSYNPYPDNQATTPTCGWRDHGIVDTAFIQPDKYSHPDIICHIDATHATEYVEAAAGEVITIQWTKWPESHHGPVITYMASCNGDCLTVNKEDLEFHKLDAAGQLVGGKGNSDPGKWAADVLRENGNKYDFRVPECIAPGPYIVRHEIIALMGAEEVNGAQNYPNCFNVMVTGSGTDKLTGGTKGTDLYQANDPGLKVQIYGLTDYTMPGPEIHTCGAIEQTPTPTTTPTPGTSATSLSQSASQSTPSAIPYDYSNSTYTSPPPTTTSYSEYPSSSPLPYGNHPMPSPKPYGGKEDGGKYPSHDGADNSNDGGSKTYGDENHDGNTSGGSTYGGNTYGGTTDSDKSPSDSHVSPDSHIAAGSPTTDGSDFNIPADATIQQLLAWLEKIVAILKSKFLAKNYRRHARDISI